MNITYYHVQQLWPHWRLEECQRFTREVFGERDESKPYETYEFLCMAVDRWFAHVLPQFNESQRHYVIKHLSNVYGKSPLPDYADKVTIDEDPIEGFFINVFDDRWVTWTMAGQILDLKTFERLTELPQPHVWCTILGVTPLYFRLLKDMERMDATSSSQPA